MSTDVVNTDPYVIGLKKILLEASEGNMNESVFITKD